MGHNGDKSTSFRAVHELLRHYLPPVRSMRGAYTLERMQKLMEFLGNPQNSYKVIHVAGTSGKTSTCYYVASFLKQAGLKTGMTVSPHIDEINERIQVNLRPIAEKKFCDEFSIFLRLVEKSKIKPTYFEVLTAFALWEFKRLGCEYVVIEVGMGGLLDATNVIQSKKKLNIITDIGLDHESVLGKTTAQIASQKSGIIKPYNVVICYEQDDEIMQVIREVANQEQAELHELWPLKSRELPHNLPLFQRRNWYLALSAYNILAERDNLPELTEAQLSASTNTYIPARMETRTIGKQVLIMDGAHNQQKLEAFVLSVKQQYSSQKFQILISFLGTKQEHIQKCLTQVLPICESLIITSFETENKEKTSINPLKIAEACEELEFRNWQIIDDPASAFRALMKTRGKIKIITGSFYLLNHIRPLLPK